MKYKSAYIKVTFCVKIRCRASRQSLMYSHIYIKMSNYCAENVYYYLALSLSSHNENSIQSEMHKKKDMQY